MTARGWRRLGAGLAAAIVGVLGWRAWEAHAEDARKAELLAEIETARNARWGPSPPPATKAEREVAELYRRAVVTLSPNGFAEFHIGSGAPPSKEQLELAAKFVGANGRALAFLEEAGSRGSCRFEDGSLPEFGGSAQLTQLLSARGWLELHGGKEPRAAATASLLLKVGRDLDRMPPSRDRPFVLVFSRWTEETASDLLATLVLRDGLTREGAEAALAAAEGPWDIPATERHFVERSQDLFDSRCIWAVGPGMVEYQETMTGKRDVPDKNGNPARMHELVPPPPTAAEIRDVRAAESDVYAAARRRDLAALSPGGALDHAYAGWDRWRADPTLSTPRPPWCPEDLWALDPESIRRRIRAECLVAVRRAAIAIRAFQVREGRTPGTLDELVPGTIREIPLDPFDGKPLLYEAVPTGWVVSSRVWSGYKSLYTGLEEEVAPVEVRFPRPAK